jgi:hypothetical protein
MYQRFSGFIFWQSMAGGAPAYRRADNQNSASILAAKSEDQSRLIN